MQNHDRSVVSSCAPPERASFIEQSPNIEHAQAQAAVQALLQRTDARLVTIVGSRGVGKTRLARALASQGLAAYPDGVYLVELAALREPQLVLAAIARVLALPIPHGTPLLDALCAWLCDRAVLLVLDGCDQLRSIAPLLQRVLSRTRFVQLLITSCAPVGCPGEQLYTLAPLTLPPSESPLVPDALLRYDATRLFAKHAAAARTSVELNATNASAVAALCARLAGLPLAVELAAARLPELTPQQILAQLEEQLRQLAAAGPALAPPQLALRAVVDWSLGRLRPVEQQLFGRLSLFAGGWDVAAVDSICIGPGGVELDSIDAMELFADYGLLVRCPTPQQRRRFRLPEALRPFAAQRLQADPVLAELHYQHATHYLTDPLVGAPERRDDDLANLCAALGWAAAHGHIEMAQRLVGVLWRLAWQRGDVAEIQRWVAQALASRPSKRSLPSTLRAVVAAGAGQRAFERGNYARAAERWQESLLLCEALDDEMGATQARLGLGAALRLQGQRARSEACYAQALATLRASHDAPGVRVALRTMAAAALRQHDLVEAAKLYHDLLALAQRANDTYAEAQALRQLGVVAQHEGDQARARSYYWRSLLLFLQRNDQRAAAQGLIDVAGTLERQHVGLAARLLGAADLHCVVSQAKPWSEHPANARLVKQIRRRCGNVYFEYSYRVGWWQDWSKALAEAAATVDEQSDQGVQPVGRPATPKSLALL